MSFFCRKTMVFQWFIDTHITCALTLFLECLKAWEITNTASTQVFTHVQIQTLKKSFKKLANISRFPIYSIRYIISWCAKDVHVFIHWTEKISCVVIISCIFVDVTLKCDWKFFISVAWCVEVKNHVSLLCWKFFGWKRMKILRVQSGNYNREKKHKTYKKKCYKDNNNNNSNKYDMGD